MSISYRGALRRIMRFNGAAVERFLTMESPIPLIAAVLPLSCQETFLSTG